jgi:hypothetical protein
MLDRFASIAAPQCLKSLFRKIGGVPRFVCHHDSSLPETVRPRLPAPRERGMDDPSPRALREHIPMWGLSEHLLSNRQGRWSSIAHGTGSARCS